ncbi:MAG: hypothetical protein GY731_15095 [Gammaproteobacteria bacterium]|nr:hypothetical protein [Gammaproteobacteria bacterium]
MSALTLNAVAAPGGVDVGTLPGPDRYIVTTGIPGLYLEGVAPHPAGGVEDIRGRSPVLNH